MTTFTSTRTAPRTTSLFGKLTVADLTEFMPVLAAAAVMVLTLGVMF